ncbi:hypothetical protein ACGFZJ_07305 [Streptomyces sp. NPDC048253]|uniref:hypothetical protein n=1 Tax=Streptomyces sp. NPDC048253 TaxID=3365524 RepID=UPI0037227E5B
MGDFDEAGYADLVGCALDNTLPDADVTVDVYKYGTDGAVGTTKTVQWDHASNAPFDQRATINGRNMLRISAGTLTGYWVWHNNVTTDGL